MWSQHYAATKSLQYQWLSHQVPCRYPGLPDTSLPRNNMALCDLKRQEWGRAVDTTTEILQRNAKNTKVLKILGAVRTQQPRQPAQKTLIHGAPKYNHAFTMTQCYLNTRFFGGGKSTAIRKSNLQWN